MLTCESCFNMKTFKRDGKIFAHCIKGNLTNHDGKKDKEYNLSYRTVIKKRFPGETMRNYDDWQIANRCIDYDSMEEKCIR